MAKKLKRLILRASPIRLSDGIWARTDAEKGSVFAQDLGGVFQSNPQLTEEELSLSEILRFSLDHNDPKKASSFDLITGKMTQELTISAMIQLPYISNGVFCLGYFPK